MCVDARGQSKQNFLRLSLPLRFPVNRVNFFCIVRDKVTDIMLYRVSDVTVCLIIAVKICVLDVIAGLQRRINFTGGNNVDAHPFLGHDLIKPLEAVCLGSVKRSRFFSVVFAQSVFIQSAFFANFVLVHQIERCSVFFCQLHNILSGKKQVSPIL